MVAPYIRHILILLLFSLSGQFGWTQTVFSEVTLNKNNVYVGEAVELTVGVYTSTWFTQGVDIGNIKVNGAFSVYFRSVSTTIKVKGKNYAGVKFIYNIFPFENQDIIIPSLTVQIETPNEGDYKGLKRTLKTKEKRLKIKPFPPGIDKSTWMVTNTMSVGEQWLGNRKEVKVGDVLERKITRRSYGTVVELIPPILWDSIPHVSLYPSKSTAKTNKSRTSISAVRSDGVRYLFEEEGAVSIPEMEFVWWNPYKKRFLKKTLKGLTLNVLPNPDLEMLKTAKKELSASIIEDDTKKAEDVKFLIFGLSLKQFIIGLILTCVILFFVFKTIRKSIKVLKHKYGAYKKSEVFAFKQVINSANSHDRKLIIPLLYKWLDQFNLEEPTLKAFAIKSGYSQLIDEVDQIEKQLKQDNTTITINKDIWRIGRKKTLNAKKQVGNKDWINP